MYRIISGVLLTLATVAGAYAVASTTATSVASTFITTETASHSRNLEFGSAAKRTSAELRAARVKCDALASKPKRACHAERRMDEQRAFKAAQL